MTVGIVNNTIKDQCFCTMEMHYFYLFDGYAQQSFDFYTSQTKETSLNVHDCWPKTYPSILHSSMDVTNIFCSCSQIQYLARVCWTARGFISSYHSPTSSIYKCIYWFLSMSHASSISPISWMNINYLCPTQKLGSKIYPLHTTF